MKCIWWPIIVTFICRQFFLNVVVQPPFCEKHFKLGHFLKAVPFLVSLQNCSCPRKAPCSFMKLWLRDHSTWCHTLLRCWSYDWLDSYCVVWTCSFRLPYGRQEKMQSIFMLWMLQKS